jgi:hypothetical protein
MGGKPSPPMRPHQWLLAALLSALLLVMWSRQLDDAPIISDAAQSLRMGINFERYGILSMDHAPPFRPTNFREPLVPLVSAVAIRIIDGIAGASAPESYFSGRRLQYLKYQNLLWLSLLSFGTFWFARQMTSSSYVGLLAVVFVNVPFRPHIPPGLIDDLMNEIPSAAIQVVAAGALAIAFNRGRPTLFALSGLMFGALTLTKAVMLYVFIVLAGILACLYLTRITALSLREAVRNLALFVGCFVLIVAPWMVRNHLHFGTYEITQRAGYALVERSLEDQMSDEEYRGAYYLWAAHPLQKRLGTWLGFSQDDLLPGGRLQRLQDDPDSAVSQADVPYEEAGTPEKAVTFYRAARAELVSLMNQYRASGSKFPDVEADAAAKKSATQTILHHPWRHLVLTPLFLWRASAETALILIVALGIAAWKRRYDLALFILPALGTVAAYALSSPFFPRYDYPMHLMAILLLPILAAVLIGPRTAEPAPHLP